MGFLRGVRAVDAGHPSYLLRQCSVLCLQGPSPGARRSTELVRASDNQIFADLWPWLVLSSYLELIWKKNFNWVNSQVR